MTSPRLVAVIPALNEEKTIAAVVDAAKKYVDEVIVVDDASSDSTASVARQKGATVVSHKIRGGYDKTIGDGFEMAVAIKAGIVMTLDADGQHDPSDIPRLIQPIEKSEADIVVGRRIRRARISETLFAESIVSDCISRSSDILIYFPSQSLKQVLRFILFMNYLIFC